VLIYREWRDVEESPFLADSSEVQVSIKSNEWITAAVLDLSTAIVPVNWQDRAALFGWNAPFDSQFGTAQWVSRAIDLSNYAGQTIRLRFAFNSRDAAFNTFEGWYVDDVGVFDTALFLRAAGKGPGAGARDTALTVRQAEPLLAEALTRWQAAGVDASILGQIDILITSFNGTTLGLASGNIIWLDDNAAGWGWFVDPMPHDDTEFTIPSNQSEQGRVDLLSALPHEVGHLLGQGHDADGLMAETLADGRRLTVRGDDAEPSSSSADTLFALLWADEGSAWVGTSSVGQGRRKR
jgi:hypothetical protein